MGRARLEASSIGAAVAAGGVVAATDLMMEISFAALVFAGPLQRHVGAGIGYFLFGSLVVAFVVAIAGGFPNAVALTQDTPAVILAAAVAAAVATIPPGSDAVLPTVVAMTVVSTLAAAALFGVVGVLRLAELVRYVPYPVIGGFLAGTGWLLFDGGLVVVTGSGSIGATLLHPEVAVAWLPALAVAVVALAAVRRGAGPLALPLLLLGLGTAFHVGLAVAGVPVARARALGWLLGPFPTGSLWQPPTPATFQLARWDLIADAAGTLAIMLVIALLSLLLNITGMELATGRDVDVNRELRVTSVANVLSGVGGGPVGYHALSLSALSHRLSSRGRLTSVVLVVAFGGALLGGAPVLALVPTPVPGAVLLFLGLDFLVTWLYDARVRLTRGEHLIIVVITLAMATVGVLEGVTLGILLAMLLFVAEYSRGTPIRWAATGRTYRSNVDRSPVETAVLREQGDDILVLELQRFIFFGTANRLLQAVRSRLDGHDHVPRFLVLDFRRVTGLDASAGSSFAKIGQYAAARSVSVIMSGLSGRMRDQLGAGGFAGDEPGWRIVADLDHGVEWCEEQVLADRADPEADHGDAVVDGQVDLMASMRPHHLPAGATLIAEGDHPDGLYYLRSGRLTAQIERDGDVVRLRRMRPGVFVGELSLYADTVASASVVADEPSVVLFLPVAELQRLEREQPATAAALHRQIARVTSARLLDATVLLSTLR